MGYAIGHYARWIKRGAVRIDASSSDRLLQVTAFKHVNEKRMILVIINNSASTRNLNIDVKGMMLGGNLIGEQSTATGYWQPVPAFMTTSPTSFILPVSAKSVTTIVGETAARQDNN
jgi:Glycosyl hydrolase family 30 beta sandwich domain